MPQYCNGNTVTVPFTRDGGADFIERNAMVLVELIKQTNQKLQASGSNEKIILIGPSMGGLISRYALRYMELNGMTHNCKLWVSFDSPHNGANIMIGAQQFLDFFGNQMGVEGARNALNQRLNSPAAKQMLLHHYSAGEQPAGAPNFRQPFVDLLNNVGFPQDNCLRKVSLVNGSRTGVAQGGFTPYACSEAFYLRAQLSGAATAGCLALGFAGSAITPILGFAIQLGCISLRDRLLEGRIYIAPANADRCVTMRKNITAFGAGVAERFANGRGNGQGSIDLLPGGTYDVINDIQQQSAARKWYYFSTGTNRFPSMNFIPTVSSCALNQATLSGRNWADPLTFVDLNNPKPYTPFDAISAPDNNQEHVLLTQAGVDFVRQQITLANQ